MLQIYVCISQYAIIMVVNIWSQPVHQIVAKIYSMQFSYIFVKNKKKDWIAISLSMSLSNILFILQCNAIISFKYTLVPSSRK